MATPPWIKDSLPQKDSNEPGVKDLYKSPDVFANNANVVLYDPPSGGGGVSAADVYYIRTDEDMIDASPEQVSAYQNTLVGLGLASQDELNEGNSAAGDPNAPIDNSPPKASGKGKILDYERFKNLTSFPDSLVLTPKGTTLGEMTTQTQLPEGRVRAVRGLTVQQVVFNLANLAYNIYEPLKLKYPNCILGNTFRPSGKPQHGQGMAADLKFRGMPKNEYIHVATWIRDNLPFDQLIMENSPKGDMWIHCSFYSGFGRRKSGAIGHMINGTNYKQGLRDLSFLSYVRNIPTA